MKEKLIDGGLLLFTLAYWLLSGKLSAHFWESVTPWIWVICLIVVAHTISACKLLWYEVPDDIRARQKSIILSQYGKPLELQKAKIPTYRAQIIGMGSSILAICIVCSYLTWKASHLDAPEQVENIRPPDTVVVSVFSDCRSVGLPITIPPNQMLHLVPLNKKAFTGRQGINWGAYNIPNDTDNSVQWPSKDKLEQAKTEHDFGNFIWKCELSNHGNGNLTNVGLRVRLWFGNDAGQNGATEFDAIVGPIDAGHRDTLYFVNDCPTNVSGIVPDTAIVKVAGDDRWRTVTLARPHSNPVEQIMEFFPTKIRWVGATPCG